MKSKLTILAVWVSFLGYAQNIDNPSFDSVYFGGIDRIFQWVTSDGVGIHGGNTDTISPLQPNTFYDATSLQFSEILNLGVFIDTTPYSNWALRLKSQPQKYKIDGSPYESYVVNGTHFYTDSTGYIDFSKCGTPFTGRPTALTGFYKLIEFSAAPNFGLCEILLKRYNSNTKEHDTIAYVKEYLLFNASANWQPFTIPINYVSNAQPDTIIVILKPAITPHLPVTFWVDHLNFVYGSIHIQENIFANYKVQPNPVNSTLKIEAIENDWLDFTIIDVSGKEVMKGQRTKEIDTELLNQGLYHLIIQDKRGNYSTLKFLKY